MKPDVKITAGRASKLFLVPGVVDINSMILEKVVFKNFEGLGLWLSGRALA